MNLPPLRSANFASSSAATTDFAAVDASVAAFVASAAAFVASVAAFVASSVGKLLLSMAFPAGALPALTGESASVVCAGGADWPAAKDARKRAQQTVGRLNNRQRR